MLEAEGSAMEQRALAAEAEAQKLARQIERLRRMIGDDTTAPSPAAAIPAAASGRSRRAEPEPEPAEPAAEGWGLSALSDAVKQGAAAAAAATGELLEGSGVAAALAEQPAPDPTVQVRWSRFDQLWVADGQRRQCLCLADAKSCQIWDVEEPGRIRQLLELQLSGVSCIAPLHGAGGAASDAGTPLAADASVVAIAATDDEDQTTLTFYSLARGAPVSCERVQMEATQAALDALFAEQAPSAPKSPSPPPPIAQQPSFQEVQLEQPSLRLRLPAPVSELLCAPPHLVVAVGGVVALLDSNTALPLPAQPLRPAAARKASSGRPATPIATCANRYDSTHPRLRVIPAVGCRSRLTSLVIAGWRTRSRLQSQRTAMVRAAS